MPPFDRLACVSSDFPVVGKKGNWSLAPAIAKQWENLENNLLFIGRYLQSNSPSNILLPLDFRLVSRPEEYGYKRCHKSRFGAQRSARYSRDAFLPLMAWCAYIISYDHVLITPPNQSGQVLRWEFILYQSGVNPDSVEELKRSELVDFSPTYPRAGLLLAHDRWAFHNIVPRLRRDNIPVWIHWGAFGSIIGDFGPLGPFKATRDEIAEAIKARDQAAIWADFAKNTPIIRRTVGGEPNTQDTAGDQATSPSAPITSTPSNIPPPEPFSGQKPGETWKEYFSRMEKKREQRLATEPEGVKVSRLSREQAQRSHPLPGSNSKAPVVWHWQADHETGFRIRTRVSRQMVTDIWEQYTNTQRIYNSLTNDWDICTELDPDAPHETADWDEADFGMQVDSMPTSPPRMDSSSHTILQPALPALPFVARDSLAPLPTTLQQPAVPAPHTLHQLAVGTPAQSTAPAPVSPAIMPTPSQQVVRWRNEHADNFNDPSTVSELSIPDHTIETLYERYGFIDPGTTNMKFEFKTNWSTMSKILGRKDAAIPSSLRAPISHFVECMTCKESDPKQLWDLSPDCDSMLVDNLNNGLVVRPTGGHYILSAKRDSDNDVPWLLVLGDAATVLECFRRPSTSIREIAKYLFWSGRPFSTRIRREECPPPPCQSRPVMTLGWRPPSHRPTTYEYNYYESLRTSFFCHPHSRAAAHKKGGIIWRLSLESTSSLIDEIVLDGPSEEVLSHGTHRGSDGTLWDDEVSENEMDLICGVYKVLTGEFLSK